MDPSNPVENPPKVENVKRAENPSNIENVKPAENPPETVNVKPAENPPETENVKPTENSPETENVEPAAKRPVPPAYELLPENFKATVDQHCPLVVTRGLSAKSDSAYNQVSPPQDRESSSQTSVSAAGNNHHSPLYLNFAGPFSLIHSDHSSWILPLHIYFNFSLLLILLS